MRRAVLRPGGCAAPSIRTASRLPPRGGAAQLSDIDELVARGEIGGRTARVVRGGRVECYEYPVAELTAEAVRVVTVRSAVSPGTELTYIGRRASNPYLRRRWDPDLRLFVEGGAPITYPIVFGYRAAGVVIESKAPRVPVGARVFGKWRHTEFTTLASADAEAQLLPDELSFDDGVDLAQMLPIALNAVAFAEGRQAGAPVVVFGSGPVGLLTAQAARASGASAVYVVDRIPSRLDIARWLQLETHLAEGDVAASLKRRLGTEAIPVAFECAGSAVALHEACRVVRRQGTVVAVGFYQGDANGLRLGEEFHHNGVEIRSGQVGNLHGSLDQATIRARAVELARSGQVLLGRLPRLELPVEQAAAGFAALGRPAEVLQVSFKYD